MEKINKRYGLIVPEIQTKEQGSEYILGGSKLKGEIINLYGNWDGLLPAPEKQSKKFETQNCTAFATLSCVEALLKSRGIEVNYSDRYLGICADTDPYNGNDPHAVAETLRKSSGALPEELLPFSDDLKAPEDYYKPKPVPQELRAEAQKFYDEWNFKHEWVYTQGTPLAVKKLALKGALKLGPVAVAVYAWHKEGDVYTKPEGVEPNHWVQLVKYDSEGRPVIFDSYADGEGDPFLKTLSPDYDFVIAKVYYLEPAKPKLDIIKLIVDAISKLLPFFTLQVKQKLEEKPVVTPDEVLPPPVKPPKKESKIEQWAKAVQVAEGWTVSSVSYRCKNPGNLKYAPLTVSFGATGKLPASDGGYFCIFPSYEVGFKALCDFLKLGAEDRLKAYHNSRTLLAFTKKYANPPNDGYARGVAKALGVDVNINIKELL